MVWLGLTGNGSNDPGLTDAESGGGVTARRSRWRPVATVKLLPFVGRGSPESARNDDDGVSFDAGGCAASSNGGARGSFNRCR